MSRREPVIRTYSAPAKLNISLHVRPPSEDGFHPIESLVQTVEWCDWLTVEPFEDYRFSMAPPSDFEDNLADRAWRAVASTYEVPPARLMLSKELPTAAGLGGGSSDAAAALLAATRHAGLARRVALDTAPDLGADVPLFLEGGTLVMSGRGEILEPQNSLRGFCAAVVVPGFELATSDVYGKWDELEGPEGEVTPDRLLPPPLRGGMPVRNDLLPAALAFEPLLGDFMADVRATWEVPVFLTGSGSACFGFFPSLGEAEDAALTIPGTRASHGVELRPIGVAESGTRPAG